MNKGDEIMSQFNYIDFYLDVNGNITESNLSQVVQHSTNTIVRVLSPSLTVDSVFLSFKQVDGTALPKKLALLQPALLEGNKVWQYRLTESDTALANPSPSPFKLTISLKKDETVNQLPEQTLTMVRSLQSAIVIPDASSLDGISDGFNAVSEEVIRLDSLRSTGITNVIDNLDGTVTIVWEDGELKTTNLTGPAGTVTVGSTSTGDAGTNATVTNTGTIQNAILNFTIPRGADAVIGPDLTAIEALTGTGYAFRNSEGNWSINTLDLDLQAIGALTGAGLLRRTGPNTWVLDSSEYISSLSVSAPLTISGTGSNRTIAINTVTQSNAGVMGIADKIKLDGIATNANNYVHPTGFTNQPTTALTGMNVISQITVNDNGHVSGVTSRAIAEADLPTISVSRGGTGLTTLNSGQALIGNGTGSLNFKVIADSSSASAIGQGTSLVTERDIYYGLPFINGDHTYTSASTFFAPTTAGTNGYTLKSLGVGAPVWDLANSHDHGNILSTGSMKSPYNVAGLALTTTEGGFIIARNISDSISASALGTSENLVTERDVYHGLANINNGRQTSGITVYAPTTAGTSGFLLTSSGGTSAPVWTNPATVVGITGDATYLGQVLGSATNARNDTGATISVTSLTNYKFIVLKLVRGAISSIDIKTIPTSLWGTNEYVYMLSSKDIYQATGLGVIAADVRRESNTLIRVHLSYADTGDRLEIYGMN
jgi:hypothetical protein